MTGHRTLPSEVEPDGLADLIADCAELPRQMLDLTEFAHIRPSPPLPAPRRALVIPDTAASMLDGLGDYGC